jgi:hypothetical protein
MSTIIKRLREAASFLGTYVIPAGAVAIDTTNNRICIGDGSTAGGWPAAKFAEVDLLTRTPIADASYAATNTDRFIAYTSLTAARTVTLPAANGVAAETAITIYDETGACTSTNTITISRHGADTINGAASYVLQNQFSLVSVRSNGSNTWVIDDRLGTVPNNTLVANISGANAPPQASNYSTLLDAVLGSTAGTVATRGGSTWTASYPGLVYLNTLTASNSASISDTSSITSAFNDYLLVFDNILPATNAVALELQIQEGGAFLATNYVQAVSAATTYFDLSQGTVLANTANRGFCGSIYLYNVNAAAARFMGGTCVFSNSSATISALTLGGLQTATTNPIRGVQILASSGNLTSGSVRIYGIRSS